MLEITIYYCTLTIASHAAPQEATPMLQLMAQHLLLEELLFVLRLPLAELLTGQQLLLFWLLLLLAVLLLLLL